MGRAKIRHPLLVGGGLLDAPHGLLDAPRGMGGFDMRIIPGESIPVSPGANLGCQAGCPGGQPLQSRRPAPTDGPYFFRPTYITQMGRPNGLPIIGIAVVF